ncbi:MAG: MATE family efflux transporter [Hyphomicrobium sp.]
MSVPERVRRGPEAPRFVTGPVLRHILEMTGAGAIGLMAIFLGDLANIFFLSRAGDQSVVAAVGYASSILYFSTSIGIGLSIATSSLVAPAIGANVRARARRLSSHAHLLAFFISAMFAFVLWFFIPALLRMLGAEGEVLRLATVYLAILIPTLPLLAVAMTSMAVLRSVGDAKRSMYGTLSGAAVNTVLDAILILHFELGIEGAAIASAAARLTVVSIGLYGVGAVHKLLARMKPAAFAGDVSAFMAVAVPAILTNIATPLGNAFVTAAVAPFGDGAVAGWAVIGRIIPVAFGAIYALSGSVGPIIGQNLGAKRPDRMRAILTQSLLVMTAFTAVAWAALAVLCEPMAAAFNASGEARDLIVFFCRWLSPLFVFLGAVFVANAIFNALGKAHTSTLLNWGRATFGTMPFVLLGASLDGARGALTGNMAGGILFGVLAVWLAFRLISQIDERLRPNPAV